MDYVTLEFIRDARVSAVPVALLPDVEINQRVRRREESAS